MGSLYLNKLSREDKENLIGNLDDIQNGNCFICGKSIDRTLQDFEIDHVEPTTKGGKDGPENFALTHSSCNRSKQASNLRVARVLSQFAQLKQAIEENDKDKRAPDLGDVLTNYKGAKHKLKFSIENSTLKTSYSEVGSVDVRQHPIYEDKLSGFRYSFLDVPIEYLHHDRRINPRPIGGNLRKLVEEFHQERPQLHIALGWVETTGGNSAKIKIFDGQHKAAAQILLGIRCLPVRVFIDPNTDVLLTTNTRAGTTLRQVAFDKSVQRSLGSSLLSDRINRYKEERGIVEEDENFSEQDLVDYFRGEHRELKRYVIDRVRNGVTKHSDNKLHDFIDYGGRGTERPLSYSTVEKTFYSFFIYGEMLKIPFNFKFDEGLNPRQLEISQLVRLMNIVADQIFIDKFDNEIGTARIEQKLRKGEDIPEQHLCAFRMAKEEIIHNWLRYVKQIIEYYFIQLGIPYDSKKLLHYEIPEQCWNNIRIFIEGLMKLPIWVNKDLSATIFGTKQTSDFWQTIFETGRTPDRILVLPDGGIHIIKMLKDG